jgi:hypothetical protein
MDDIGRWKDGRKMRMKVRCSTAAACSGEEKGSTKNVIRVKGVLVVHSIPSPPFHFHCPCPYISPKGRDSAKICYIKFRT